MHCASQTMTSEVDVLATPLHTGPTLPPSRPVPFRPTVTVTVQLPVVAPQEKVVLA